MTMPLLQPGAPMAVPAAMMMRSDACAKWRSWTSLSTWAMSDSMSEGWDISWGMTPKLRAIWRRARTLEERAMVGMGKRYLEKMRAVVPVWDQTATSLMSRSRTICQTPRARAAEN